MIGSTKEQSFSAFNRVPIAMTSKFSISFILGDQFRIFLLLSGQQQALARAAQVAVETPLPRTTSGTTRRQSANGGCASDGRDYLLRLRTPSHT